MEKPVLFRKTRASQLMRRLKLSFMVPQTLSVHRLEKWQIYWEDETVLFARPKIATEVSDDESELIIWLQNVLRTIRDLLLASDLPCFEHIRLLNWSKREDEQSLAGLVLNVEFEIPAFESYSPGTVGAAVSEAISCVGFMTSHEPSSENRETLWKRVKEVSKPRIASGNRINTATFHVLQTAYNKGIPLIHLGKNVYQLGWGAAARVVNRSTTTADPALGVRLTMNKHLNSELLRRAGLPAPVHYLVTSPESAQKAAKAIGWPVVVKPTDLERGEGITIDVQPNDLDKAVRTALDLSPSGQALVERQVHGICYRIFVAFGQMLYAVKRDPIGVFGDGKQTVAELVTAELALQALKPAWRRTKLVPIDDLARATLEAAGLSEDSVPEDKVFVSLRKIQNTAWGGVAKDATEEIHPENVRISLSATALCGLNTAGVDIITEDITKPWYETGAIINEVNFSPSLGGSEVSCKYLSEYVERVMQGSGLITVSVFVGGAAAMKAAQSHLQSLHKQGTEGYLTNATSTLDAKGQNLPLAVNGLPGRIRALILSRSVEALVIVVQSDDVLDEPLPLEGVDHVQFVDEAEVTSNVNDTGKRRKKLEELLSGWVWDGSRE